MYITNREMFPKHKKKTITVHSNIFVLLHTEQISTIFHHVVKFLNYEKIPQIY